jgi:hypothetical protein
LTLRASWGKGQLRMHWPGKEILRAKAAEWS